MAVRDSSLWGVRSRRRRLSLLAAAAVAAGLGAASGSAIAGHQHYASLWTHGCGDCSSTSPNAYIHPFLDSSDGTWRNSCVAWAEISHGPIQCQIAAHNHVDYSPFEERNTSAHTESSQTSLAHHHHFPH